MTNWVCRQHTVKGVGNAKSITAINTPIEADTHTGRKVENPESITPPDTACQISASHMTPPPLRFVTTAAAAPTSLERYTTTNDVKKHRIMSFAQSQRLMNSQCKSCSETAHDKNSLNFSAAHFVVL